MEADGTANVRRIGRTRGEFRCPTAGSNSVKEAALKAAKDVLDGTESQTSSAAKWGVSERMVHYYRGVLNRAELVPEESPPPRSQTPVSDVVSVSSVQSKKADVWDDYCAAYIRVQ